MFAILLSCVSDNLRTFNEAPCSERFFFQPQLLFALAVMSDYRQNKKQRKKGLSHRLMIMMPPGIEIPGGIADRIKQCGHTIIIIMHVRSNARCVLKIYRKLNEKLFVDRDYAWIVHILISAVSQCWRPNNCTDILVHSLMEHGRLYSSLLHKRSGMETNERRRRRRRKKQSMKPRREEMEINIGCNWLYSVPIVCYIEVRETVSYKREYEYTTFFRALQLIGVMCACVAPQQASGMVHSDAYTHYIDSWREEAAMIRMCVRVNDQWAVTTYVCWQAHIYLHVWACGRQP